ncbi:MAG: oligosaccharide flippase family protein, partial [Rhodanobacter sp.]
MTSSPRPEIAVRSRRHVVGGSALQALVRLLLLTCGAVSVAIQVRTLTVPEYGVFVTILSVIALLSGLTDIGLTNTAVQRMARSPDRQGAIAGGLLIARGALGLALGAIGAGVSLLLFTTSTERFAAALMIATLPLGMLTALQAVFVARLQLMKQNLLLTTQGLLWLAVVVTLGWIQAGLVMFAAGFLGCALIQASIVWLLLWRQARLDVRSGIQEVPSLLRQAIPLGLGGIGTTAYYRLSGIILFVGAGPIAAASYSAAFKVVDMLQAIPASLLATLIPLLARALEAGDRLRVTRMWDLASRVTLASSTMVAAGVAVTAPQIVSVLYGQAYADSVPLLRVVAFAFVPICLGWLSTGALTATGRVKGYA